VPQFSAKLSVIVTANIRRLENVAIDNRSTSIEAERMTLSYPILLDIHCSADFTCHATPSDTLFLLKNGILNFFICISHINAI